MPNDKPETLSQAHHWQAVKSRYEYAGLCTACASQCAWGHQLGFTRLDRRPCDACQSYVLPSWLLQRHGMRGQTWLNAVCTYNDEF